MEVTIKVDVERQVEVLLGAAAFFIALGAWIFSTREFRVKTPEGS